jgi:hypothetical protein
VLVLDEREKEASEMKTLRAVMFSSVCALTTAGATFAPMLDVERSDTNVIVAETPTTSTVPGVLPAAQTP